MRPLGLTFALVLAMAAAPAACGGSSTGPGEAYPALTQVTRSAHYLIHTALSGQLPALSSLLRSSDFARVDDNMTYPSAGSFVHFLIETQGLAPLKAYFRLATFDDAAAVTESRFQSAYGRSVASFWDEWGAGLRR